MLSQIRGKFLLYNLTRISVFLHMKDTWLMLLLEIATFKNLTRIKQGQGDLPFPLVIHQLTSQLGTVYDAENYLSFQMGNF